MFACLLIAWVEFHKFILSCLSSLKLIIKYVLKVHLSKSCDKEKCVADFKLYILDYKQNWKYFELKMLL